jgi:hypothetical protein
LLRAKYEFVSVLEILPLPCLPLFLFHKKTAAARVRRATINERVFMSIPFSILDSLLWMS